MELSQQDYELIEKAKLTHDALYLAGVHEVAAVLRTASDKIFSGIHIEADAGFADICGEVAAICVMVSSGYRDLQTIVAICGDGKGGYKLLAPCGRCREVIKDFNPQAWVIVGCLESPHKMTVSELLPLHSKATEASG